MEAAVLHPTSLPFHSSDPSARTAVREASIRTAIVACPPDGLRDGYRNGAVQVVSSVWQGASLIGFNVLYGQETSQVLVPVAFLHLPQELPNVSVMPRRMAA